MTGPSLDQVFTDGANIVFHPFIGTYGAQFSVIINLE